MQNVNEDTEWNDVLRAKGIIPPKPEKQLTEDEIVQMVDATIQEKTGNEGGGGRKLDGLSLDELDELEDEEEERILLEYRAKRMQEMKTEIDRSRFGSVLEITAQDYVNQVNKAGDGIWVVLHLYKQGIPMCALLNQHMTAMAMKFPSTKFIKSVSTVCIPNYPDKNVPTIFIYYEGEMKKQYIGPDALRGMKLTLPEFEYLLGMNGAVKTTITKDPRPKVQDAMMSKLGCNALDSDSD